MFIYRYIAVCHPLKAPTMCKRSHVMKVVPILLVFLLGINSHFIWTVHIHMSLYEGKKIPQCREKDSFHTFVIDVWPWIDAFIYSFLPFVVISVMNARIIYSVVAARRGRSRMQLGGTNTNQKKPSPSENSIRSTAPSAGHDTSYRLTFMLLTISCTFLITTLPVNIIGICAEFLDRNDFAIVTRFKLVRTIAEMLMYCNHSMNFFLYCATGQKFRQQLLMLICRRSSSIYNPTTTLYNKSSMRVVMGRKKQQSVIQEHHKEEERRRLTIQPVKRDQKSETYASEEIELKRTLSGDNSEIQPRYTTLAVNKTSYTYA